MEQTEEIIRYIRRNRLSTTEVTDAMGKAGILPGLAPATPDQFRVGPVRCVFTANNSNRDLHEQIKAVREGEVVVVFAEKCEERALLGDLMARFVLLYRGAEALVVNGLVRDAARLRRERYAIWSKGMTPLGCFNTPAKPFAPKEAARLRAELDGGVAVCDDGGVTIIGPKLLNGELLEKLKRIELQEDVWYYCLNTLKWDTKKIVCDKAYLKEPEALPAAYHGQLAQLERPLDGTLKKS